MASARPVMEEQAPFTPDPDVPDFSSEIMDVFGLSADVGGGGNTPPANAGDGTEGAAAPTPQSSSAAEGVEGQQTPTTPPTPQPEPGVSQQPQPQAPAPAAAPAPAPAPAAQTTQVNPADNAELQSLKAQVQALTAMLQQQQQPQGQQPTGSPATPQAPQPTAEELARYNLAIPADVMQAIRSDDDAMVSQGMHHLLNSYAGVVHQRVMQHVDQVVSQRLQESIQQQTLSQQQQEMQRDYYSQFTDHNDPGIRLIVAQEAQTMWTENPSLAWNEQTRNSLGARVNARLGRTSAAPTPQPSPQPTPAPAPSPRPAAMTGATTRPPATGNDEGSFIADILSSR